MRKILLTVMAVPAFLAASLGVNAALTAGEATANTRPTVTVTHGVNGDGKRVVCMVASTGGVDCDFDRPTRLQTR